MRPNFSVQVGVSADGKRFLMIVPKATSDVTASPITIVLNWTDALKK